MGFRAQFQLHFHIHGPLTLRNAHVSQPKRFLSVRLSQSRQNHKSIGKLIQIWSMNSKNKALFTLSGHSNGVNCVDYFKGDKPYIISGGDDRQIKVWDFQIK